MDLGGAGHIKTINDTTAVTACMFVAPGRLEIIESTQADVQIGAPLSLVFDDLALLKQLTVYTRCDNLPMEEAEAIQSGGHIRALQALRDTKSQTGQWVRTQDWDVSYHSAFR